MELEAMFRNNLRALGLEGWQVEVLTTRELKNGNEKPEFNIRVTKAGNIRPAPLKSYSGGERQRLKVAGQAAFADVIRARMAHQPGFEIWDEPTAHLSPEGCDDLMLWMRERARVKGRQVWVIDHRTQHAGEVDMHLQFVKHHGVTKIVDDR